MDKVQKPSNSEIFSGFVCLFVCLLSCFSIFIKLGILQRTSLLNFMKIISAVLELRPAYRRIATAQERNVPTVAT
jgi:hypothetical protein